MLIIPRRKWHQGNRNSGGFDANRMPTVSGQTLSGWTQVNIGGHDGSVSFDSNGHIVFSAARYAGTAKQFTYGKATASNIVKTSTFRVSAKIKIADVNAAANLMLFNSGSARPGAINCMRVAYNATTIFWNVFDSAGTLDQSTASYSLTTGSTWYWVDLKGDGGTNLINNWYTSEASWLAESSPAASLSIAVAAVTGTVTCDRFGFAALDNANRAAHVLTAAWFDGNVIDFNDKAA